MNIFWFLPIHGDGRYLGTQHGARAVDHHYLKQIAQAADELGYGGVLIPTGRSCEDSWIVAASLMLTGSPNVFINADYGASDVPVPGGVGPRPGGSRLIN